MMCGGGGALLVTTTLWKCSFGKGCAFWIIDKNKEILAESWGDKGGFKHEEQRRHGLVERENGRVCIPFK